MKKVQYSKILLVVSCLIFILSLICVFLSVPKDLSDTTLYVTIITVTGGNFCTNVIWYMKKAQAENCYKLKMEMFKETTKQRLIYNKKMMILKKKYEVTDEELNEIENDSLLDEMNEQSLEELNNKLNSFIDEAETSMEEQS